MPYTPEQVEQYLAHVKETANDYTPEQIEEYSQHVRQSEMGFQRGKGGYEGIPDEKLNIAQKVDRFVSKPGHEMLSPGKIKAMKENAPMIIGGTAAAMGGVGLLTPGAAPAAADLAEALAYGKAIPEAVPATVSTTKLLKLLGLGTGVGGAIHYGGSMARRLLGLSGH